MTIAKALFSSHKTEWETPPELFARLNREFSFTLDVCATRGNRNAMRTSRANRTACASAGPVCAG